MHRVDPIYTVDEARIGLGCCGRSAITVRVLDIVACEEAAPGPGEAGIAYDRNATLRAIREGHLVFVDLDVGIGNGVND